MSTPSRRQQLDVIYIVRALAILGAIAVHVTSVPLGQIDANSIMFFNYNFINIFSKYGTPTFIFLSAFVLFYSYYKRPVNGKMLGRFYQRRFLYILIPYLICSVFYYVIQLYFSYGESWHQFSQQASLLHFFKLAVTGKAFYHLYFIFISIQFYILFPPMLWLLQRKPRLTNHLVWFGFILQWVFVLYNLYVWNFNDKAFLALSYFSNYFLGAYCGIKYEQVKDWMIVSKRKLLSRKAVLWVPLWLIWIVSSLEHVLLWYRTRVNGVYGDPLTYEVLWSLQTYTSSLILIQISYFLLEKLSAKMINMLIHLGVVSFGVYIIHVAILFFYIRLPVSSNPLIYHANIGCGFLVTLLASWGIVGLTNKYFKQSWLLFGAQPKVSPYREIRPRRGEGQKAPTWV